MIVVAAPILNDDLCFLKGVEEFSVQKFFTQADVSEYQENRFAIGVRSRRLVEPKEELVASDERLNASRVSMGGRRLKI